MGGAGGGKGKGRGEAERGKVEGNEEKGGKNRERMSGGEKIVEDGGTSAHSAQVLLDFARVKAVRKKKKKARHAL